MVTEPVDLIVCDASFISLAKVLDRALDFAKPGGRLIALVKPQFEAERGEIGKGGVVRDPAIRERVCAAAADWVGSRGWAVEGWSKARSPAPRAMSSSCWRRGGVGSPTSGQRPLVDKLPGAGDGEGGSGVVDVEEQGRAVGGEARPGELAAGSVGVAADRVDPAGRNSPP